MTDWHNLFLLPLAWIILLGGGWLLGGRGLR